MTATNLAFGLLLTHEEARKHNIDKIAPFDQRFSVNPHVRLT